MTRRAGGEGSLYKRSDGRWEGTAFRATAEGARRRVSVYGKSRAEAHAKLVEQLKDRADGVLVPTRAWRLAEYLDSWLPSIKLRCHPTTYLDYVSIVDNYLRPGLGTRRLTQLTVATIQRYIDGQLAAGRSIRTAHKIRTVLSSALTQAWREELIAANPARRVVLPSLQRGDVTPWTLDEVQLFLDTARQDPLYPAFLLLATYGLRRGEVLGLRWGDVDLAGRVVHVRQQIQRFDGALRATELKTAGSRRSLPLLISTADALSQLRTSRTRPDDTEALVFQTRSGQPIEPRNLARSFHRLTRQAGLRRIKLHHLRHTAATLLKNLGVPARDVQLILGHASVLTTQQLYQHADLPRQISALSELERSLLGGSRQLQPSFQIPLQGRQQSTSGSGERARTSDLRLMRLTLSPEMCSSTEVKLLARGRYLTAILGGAAVMFCRQRMQS